MAPSRTKPTKKSKEEIYAEADGPFRKWLFEERILHDHILTSSEKIVLCGLLHIHNVKADQCDYYDEKKIAKLLGLNKETVSLGVRQGVAQGWLKVHQPTRYERNEYSFNWDNQKSKSEETAQALRAKRARKKKPEAPDNTGNAGPEIAVSGDRKVRSQAAQIAVSGDRKTHVQEDIMNLSNENLSNDSTQGRGEDFSKEEVQDTQSAAKEQYTDTKTHKQFAEGSLPHDQDDSPQSYAAASHSLPPVDLSLTSAGDNPSPSNPPPRPPVINAETPADDQGSLKETPAAKKTFSLEEQRAYLHAFSDAYPQSWYRDPEQWRNPLTAPTPLDEWKAAWDIFKMRLDEYGPDVLIAGASAYAVERQGENSRYTKTPKNWLWSKEWEKPKRTTKKTTMSAVDQIIAEQLQGTPPPQHYPLTDDELAELLATGKQKEDVYA